MIIFLATESSGCQHHTILDIALATYDIKEGP